MTRILSIGVLAVLACAALPAHAQDQQHAGAWAWKPLFRHEGVEFKYIFYREADSENNGVVIMLINHNDYAVDYRFKVVFRDVDENEVVEEATGHLDAGQAKTGSADGLFWVPFLDGRSISHVGLRGYKIIRKEEVG